MHNDGILLLVNGLGMHKTTMSERVCLQSGLINIMHKNDLMWRITFLRP